ncbi:MAG: hypothetical protein ACYCZF_10890 [Anaerolineae bacterium]
MPQEQKRILVQMSFEQANWMALHSPSKGRIVDLQLSDCAYCGEPALASSVKLLTADAKRQAAIDQASHSIRVNLTIHLCNRHAVSGNRKKSSSASAAGLAFGAVGYALLNLFGVSNGLPFFTTRNLVWVVLVGIVVIVGCAILAESLGRLLKLGAGGLPPAVRVTVDAAGNLEFSFLRAECAQRLEALLAPGAQAMRQAQSVDTTTR